MPRRSPTATAACSPTSCAWPCRRATPGWRRRCRSPASRAASPAPPAAGAWERYPRGPALLQALAGGRAAHAVWQALPGECWADRLAEAAATTVAAGRGALLVVPDQRDVDALHAACTARARARCRRRAHRGAGPRGALPAVARGPARAGPRRRRHPVGGVRAGGGAGPRRGLGRRRRPALRAAGALPARPRRPRAARAHGGRGPARRRVRAHRRGAPARRVRMGARGGGRPCDGARRAPRVTAMGETDAQLARDPDARAARLPHVAFEAARAALDAGRPVLVQVPRAGYLPWLACASCRETARCRHCAGPLGLPARRPDRRADGEPDAARRRSAAGAAGPSRPSGARPAGRAGCVPGSSGPGAPPRSWAGRSPAPPCAPRVEAPPCSPRVAGAARTGRRHPGRRAGRRVRVRRGAAPRRLGPAVPARPAGGRGDAAALARRRRAGRPARRRRPGRGGRRQRPRRWCRRWSGGTRRGTRPPSWPPVPRWGSRR